jgi:hypothetical protein
MSIRGPNQEDIQKIHAEVNQIVNQRLSLATLAVTVFGVMVAWLIPQSTPHVGSNVGAFIYSALFLLTHHLTYMLRVLTTYLVEMGVSNWEEDWAVFRARYRPLGYTRPQAMIFLLLGILSTAFPFLLAMVYSISIEPMVGAITCMSLGALYVIFVSGIGFAGWFANEKEMRQRWKQLKDD